MFTGPDGKDETVIRLVGYVDPIPMGVIRVEPRKINIGSFQKGSKKEKNFKVRNIGNQSLEITKVYSATGKTLIIPKEEAKTRIPPKESMKLEITFQTTTMGPFVEVLLIDSNARNALKGQYAVMVIGQTGP